MTISSAKYFLILAQAAVIGMTSCSDDNNHEDMITMPVSLYIPIKQENTMLKSPGDPGTYEKFNRPRWAYIYLVLNYSDEGTTKTGVFPLIQELDPDLWEPTTYSGSLSTNGDSIYQYSGKLQIDLPTAFSRQWAHIYAAVSKTQLTGLATPTTEEEVKNLTFSLAGQTALQRSLQDLYSSPYNYNVEGKYYGTVSDVNSVVMHANLMLYHVAAKVDLIWNVVPNLQDQLRITEITAENQFGDNAYLFKPMENVRSNDTGAYSTTIISNDVGSQWLGRAYFYTIPFKDIRTSNTFNIRTRLRKNGETTMSYLPEFQRDISSATIFTPWVRGDLTFSTEFTTVTDDNTTVVPKTD